MIPHNPFTGQNLIDQLAHAQRINELHRSILDNVPGMSCTNKKVLWAVLNEQDAWPTHLESAGGLAQPLQPRPKQEEWALLTIKRMIGSLLSLDVIGAHFFAQYGGEATKKQWHEMM